MLNKPLLATNKNLFDKIVNANLALRKKPRVYDAFVALLKELFPEQERLVSIPVMIMMIMLGWFFMWSYVANTSWVTTTPQATTVVTIDTPGISTSPTTTISNPEDQMAMILYGQFWQ